MSQDMANELNLKTKQLGKPYKVVWFKEGGEVPVTDRCLLKFSIKKVKD